MQFICFQLGGEVAACQYTEYEYVQLFPWHETIALLQLSDFAFCLTDNTAVAEIRQNLI